MGIVYGARASLVYPVSLATGRNLLMRTIALLLVTSAAVAQTPATDAKAYVKYEQSQIVLNHVRVVDGTGAPAKPDQMILISDGKIQSMATAGSQTPAGAQVLDLTGDTVMPGIVGMH